MNVVEIIVRQYPIAPEWREDILQEGRYALCVAARKFDPERGILFVSYASWWVRRYILRAMVRFPSKAVCYDDEVEYGNTPSGDTADRAIRTEEAQAEWDKLWAHLKPLEKQIITLHLGLEGAPLPIDEVAQRVGRSYDRVKKIYEKICKKSYAEITLF